MSPAGLIGLFVRHKNAANLLMALMLLGGLFALMRINTQLFPDLNIPVITITVAWPGASAEDVESNILAAIEPEVRFLDSIKRVQASGVEGAGFLFIEFEPDADMQRALSEIESAVGRITTLPDESERPVITQIAPHETVSRIMLTGPFSEAALKSYAKRMRDDLLSRGVDKILLVGARDEEIWVELPQYELQRLDLTYEEVARRIAQSSQDLPSGTIEGGFEQQLRSLGLAQTTDKIGAIELRAAGSGEKILLRDVATIRETFDARQATGHSAGKPAIQLHIQRSATADALEQAEIVDDYLKQTIPTLPQTLEVVHFDIQASLVRERIMLLVRNGAGGLILVLATLFLFLNGRLAFWVGAGIPIAMTATIGLMLLSGQTVNMVSLFAMIMTLGVIVDDAIVVGEHAAYRFERGLPPLEAAEAGAVRMFWPVMASSLTTMASFLPILLVGDVIGQMFSAIPMVVVAVLIASLVECFLILPGHLRGTFNRKEKKPGRLRAGFNRRFDQFRDGLFPRMVRFAYEWRYLTIAGAVGLFIVSVGLIVGGRVGFQFFPSPESDVVYANATFSPGMPRKTSEAMLHEMERALAVAEDKLTGGKGGLVRASYGSVGSNAAPDFLSVSGDHLSGITVELVPSDARDIRTAEFVTAWREAVKPLPGIERITINPRRGGPPGRDIDIRLRGGSPETLKAAANELKATLARFPGVSDVEDDLPYGKQEVLLSVTPRGAALGFTTESVGRQVRAAFQGAIAKRFARGDEEVTLRVQAPKDVMTAAALRDLYLRAPDGSEVPLSEVVAIEQGSGFARIRRQDGAREVAIVAEINPEVANAQYVLESLRQSGLPEITAKYGVSYVFAGRAEEQANTTADMVFGAQIALSAIYLILAWVFASYTRPLIVMFIIPFGLIGAVFGHLLMGFNLTMMSFIALLGLAGILVNDSIILVGTIDEHVARGKALVEAVVAGCQERLRAIILTSATTVVGLLPLLFETSMQARFLIPMAITLAFGLASATMLVLGVVPALIGIVDDAQRLVMRLRGRKQTGTALSKGAAE